MKRILILFLFFHSISPERLKSQTLYHEQFRPQIHFSPKGNWMNDPNGLVYYKGIYHMFFQYYPDSTVWGPNYWGHATSKDLMHWTERPTALAPDSLGLIASGSAVVDYRNSSGFGKKGSIPLVAIYAQINQKLEKQHQFGQYQSIAYSTDEGSKWEKYSANPVIKNPGVRDFRDPKVIWYAAQTKWVMTVATHDHVTYYSSANLKAWKKESEFGQTAGAHTGVWECPDLVPFKVDGREVWVQIVSINPGGPNGGSATQYFVGDFDGHAFKPFNSKIKWLDYGTDNYAGVTWSNTGERKIFLGWMSNWQYATVVPTLAWRSAMTVPRELFLSSSHSDYLLRSMPVKELESIKLNPVSWKEVNVKAPFSISSTVKTHSDSYELDLSSRQIKDFAITMSNKLGEEIQVGFESKKNSFFIDRSKSGKTDFKKDFAKRFLGPRLSANTSLKLKLIVDAASLELFADEGTTVMTGIFFPNQPFNQISIQAPESFLIDKLSYCELKSIW